MEFTRDFTRTRINFWKQLLADYRGKGNLKFLEIGTFEGRSAIWFLDNILFDDSCTLTIVDPFMMTWEKKFPDKNPLWNKPQVVNEIRERFYKNIDPYLKKVKIMEMTSFEALMKFYQYGMRDYFDFIYIDGSHKASDCLEDMILALRALKKGGILLMDDYQWGKQLPSHFTPKPAIDAFMSMYREEIKVLNIGSQVAILKK